MNNFIMLLTTIPLCLFVPAPSNEHKPAPSKSKAHVTSLSSEQLVGRWDVIYGHARNTLTLNPDKSFVERGPIITWAGTWRVENNKLLLLAGYEGSDDTSRTLWEFTFERDESGYYDTSCLKGKCAIVKDKTGERDTPIGLTLTKGNQK